MFGGRLIRIPIQLRDESLIALRTLAKQEYRDVRQQSAWIIEQELERRGLLVIGTPAESNPDLAAFDSLADKPKTASTKR